MTDEEVVGWFFDTSPRINGPYGSPGGDVYVMARAAYVYTVSRMPDVVEAIRAHRDETEQLTATLEAS